MKHAIDPLYVAGLEIQVRELSLLLRAREAEIEELRAEIERIEDRHFYEMKDYDCGHEP